MQPEQLEFDFGPSDVVQRFLGIVWKKFSIRPKSQKDSLFRSFWIKQYYPGPSNKIGYYVSKRNFGGGIEVEWDFVMYLTEEEAQELKKVGYADFR